MKTTDLMVAPEEKSYRDTNMGGIHPLETMNYF